MNESQGQIKLTRLVQLASEKCNGSITDEGHAELQVLLAEDAETRSAYWRMTAMHADLEWEFVGKQSLRHEVMGQVYDDLAVRSTPAVKQESSTKLSGRSWLGPFIAVEIAAALLCGWILWYLNQGDQAPQIAVAEPTSTLAEPAAAQLSSLMPNSRWSFGRAGDRNPEDFNYGDTVWVEMGLVEMNLEGGTVGQLRAPAILQLISQDRVRLLSGKIKVYAPSRTNGFTVETPSAEVVDLGTEFSVEAAETGTDLIVHGGKVDLKVPHNGENKTVTTKQFTAGQAVRVDRNGTLSRIMNVKSSGDQPALQRPASAHVISSVVDNIPRDEVWAFYEIVWNGMSEDVHVFVDRLHQWNGVSDAGMPTYLVGGDYVKTFNDDKMAGEYKMEVELAQPANLYVLLDTRVTPPKWLIDSFSDTGDQIGIDETHHHRSGYEDTTEDGPGKSIDRTHSIWKMAAPDGGTVVLGPNGEGPSQARWHNNMYGIVAVPLQPTPSVNPH